MARQTNNVVTYGLHGKIGDLLVFRQRNGKTFVSKVPKMPTTSSKKQKEHRKRFQQAVLYAKSAIANPETKALYEQGAKEGQRSFNVAVADFFNAPDIEHVDLSGYTGKVGDVIRILASDDLIVKAVSICITNADGSIVEEGDALPGAGHEWTYVATQPNDSLAGDKIVITASDLPGNITEGIIT